MSAPIDPDGPTAEQPTVGISAVETSAVETSAVEDSAVDAVSVFEAPPVIVSLTDDSGTVRSIHQPPVEEGFEAALDPRIEQRRAEVAGARTRTRRRVLLVIVTVVLMALAVPAVLNSRFLDLDQVQVIGAPTVTPDVVARLGGVSLGEPLMSLHAGAIEKRLRSQPRFSRVAVQVHLSGVLEVRLTERTTIARVVGPRRSVIAGEGGIVIDLARGDEPLPVIETPADPPIRPAARLATDIANAVDLIGSMPSGLRSGVERLVVGTNGQFTVHLTGKRTVLFGTVDDADIKIVAMETMLGPAVDNSGVCQLDIRVPGSPTMRRTPNCAPKPVVAPAPASSDPASSDPASSAPASSDPASSDPATAAAGSPDPTAATSVSPVPSAAPATSMAPAR